MIETFGEDFFDGMSGTYPLFVNLTLENLLYVNRLNLGTLYGSCIYLTWTYCHNWEITNFGKLSKWKISVNLLGQKKREIDELYQFLKHWILDSEDIFVYANTFFEDTQFLYEIFWWLQINPKTVQQEFWDRFVQKRIQNLCETKHSYFLAGYINKYYDLFLTHEITILETLKNRDLTPVDQENLEKIEFLKWKLLEEVEVLSPSEYVLLSNEDKREYLSIYKDLDDLWKNKKICTEAWFWYFETETDQKIKSEMIELLCWNFGGGWFDIESLYETIIMTLTQWKQEMYRSLFSQIFKYDKYRVRYSVSKYYFWKLAWRLLTSFDEVTVENMELFSDILEYSAYFTFDENLLKSFENLQIYIKKLLQDWNNNSIVQSLLYKYNKLSVELLWKIPPIEFQENMLWNIDWSKSQWEEIDTYILSQSAYLNKKQEILTILSNISYAPYDIHESNINTLLKYDPSEKVYQEFLSQRLWYLFFSFNNDSVELAYNNDRGMLSDVYLNRIESDLLNDASQKEWRSDNNKKAQLRFIKYANEFWILVDSRLFIRFWEDDTGSVENDQNMVLEFLKWIDTDRLWEYESQFSLWWINSIVDMLVFYMNHNNDEIRKIATQKINSSGKKTTVQEYRDQLRIEDYGWIIAKDKVAWANNTATRNKIDWIETIELSEWASLQEVEYYEAIQTATVQMEKTTVSVWWALQGALPNVWHLTDEEIQLQDSIDEITFFVEKLQKYAMAELYMFMREQNCSDEFIQEVTEYFDSDKFTGVVLFTNQPERRTSWYSSWALWTASVKNWNSSIALNLSLISESLWNESKNESKSLYDAITDVYLHEFFHIVDYSKKWDQEDDFDKVKFNEVSLEEVMTEICSTYLEWLWNEKELKDITKLWERKWINSISFLQFLNEWYEVWSDNYELLEFFEGARKEWKLWYMLEILVNWSIDDCKKLIDEVFKHSDPKKTWRDIIPWLQ